MKIILLVIIFIQCAWAASFNLNDIEINCSGGEGCEQRKQRFSNLRGEYRSQIHLKDTLRILASDGGYQLFSYELIENGKGVKIRINMRLKPIIAEINIGFVDRIIEIDPIQLLSIKEGDFFETSKVKENLDAIQKKLEGLGFPKNSLEFQVVDKKDKIRINIIITLGPPRIFRNIKTNANSVFVNDFLIKKFHNLYNKPFDFTKFKLYLDDAQKELFNYGYYLINLDFTPIIKSSRVTLDIKVSNDRLHVFEFDKNERQARDQLLTVMTDLFRQYKRPLNEPILKQTLLDHYKKLAYVNPQVTIHQSTFINKYKEEVLLYKIEILEGEKSRVNSITLSGNSFASSRKLRKMYKENAFELASLNYYDDEYLNYYADLLKNFYIKHGFVQVRINGPIKTYDPDQKKVQVEYMITEGKRAYVKNVNFSGLPPEFEDRILGKMTNKVGGAFNPITLPEDLKLVVHTLQESGYYFAELATTTDDELVTYNKTGSEVVINVSVNAGPIVALNRIIFLGNDVTRKKVLLKKISLQEGELLTPTKTRDIESALSATGLFNSVSVNPVRHGSKSTSTDLIVKVTERDYKLIELAPGYRTDLGVKISGTVTIQNIAGENKSITLKSQINQRLNFQTFDPRRKKEKRQLLEHNTSLTYNQSDIFDTMIDLGTSISAQRRRFYSFDADILRFNTTLTRDLTKRLSSSLRYQFEDITQTDATAEIDNGSFQIGAITPSLTYDLRNSQVNPVKGAFFNLSCEFANPYFLSQRTSDLTINYYKLVSRNRFYLPFKNGTVALSMVGGIQENLATQTRLVDGVSQTEGYIPNIKVFRLTGMDIVRGYNDEEINRLPDGTDIADVRVAERAYLANFKLEPRYFVNDSVIAGVFYDAGRVFVERVDFGELRDSVGITFKILTPVGTLDFDYGIKLLRKKDANGKLEDPGRFHVSIGFF
jgi:outer membrane protein insertion porin family